MNKSFDPAMERAACRPGQDSILEQVPKQLDRLAAARQSNGRKEQTSFCIVDIPERQEHGHRWAQGL